MTKANILTSVRKLLPEGDFKIIEQYLSERGRKSSGSEKTIRSALFRFLKYAQPASLANVTRQDVYNYLNDIDNKMVKKKNHSTGDVEYKKAKLSYKQTQLHYIRGFFEYYADNASDPFYKNPVPSCAKYNFTDDDPLNHLELQKSIEEQCFTIDQLIEILRYFYYNQSSKYIGVSHEYFMISVLLVVCGMRVSEAVSIRIENVDIDGRYIVTGIEDGCRKSNRKKTKPIYFCFPDVVAYLLNEYLRDLKQARPNTQWLFPSRDSKNFLPTRTFEFQLGKSLHNFPVRSHTFRKTLETFQLNPTNNVPLHIVELLSNHAIRSTVMRNYNQVTIEERRAFYDKYFPMEFAAILRYLKAL